MTNFEKLLELVRNNPGLPVIPFVGSDIVADDSFRYWHASWGDCELTKYLIGEQGTYLFNPTSRFAIEDCLPDPGFLPYIEEIPEDDKELERLYRSLPWRDAIIIHIETPNNKEA